MRYIKPTFYDKFSCTAAKCPDTCCAGWQIMIDEDSLERYGEVQGAFGKRLRNSIDWQEGCFYQHQRRCAFLNEQNLCDLYTALGSEALCETCRKYPRHVEEYEGVREWSLSLSCPVAAEMILSQQGFPEFIMEEDDEPDELEEEFEDFDLLLFTQLEDARSAIFRHLRRDVEVAVQSSDADIMHFAENADIFVGSNYVRQNMNRALDLAKKMQECLEEGRFFAIEDMIKAYEESAEKPVNELGQESSEVLEAEQPFNSEFIPVSYAQKLQLYRLIYDLERLRPEWSNVLGEMYQTLYACGEEYYTQLRKQFATYLAECPERSQQWENSGLQLFVFFTYTYFCGAVYDDWIYSKMALAVHSVEFIGELLMARWKQNGKLERNDYVELSYRYAREIEHSDQNLNQLEENFWNIFQEGIDN